MIPALDKFQPDFIFVSSGFDASFADPLGSMMLTSESFRNMTSDLISAANRHCGGRILFAHEGGYSKDYVPYCGLAVVETLCGYKTPVEDPYLYEANLWGYQSCLPHQASLIDSIAALHGLSSQQSSAILPEGLSPFEIELATSLNYLLSTVPEDRRSDVLKFVTEMNIMPATAEIKRQKTLF